MNGRVLKQDALLSSLMSTDYWSDEGIGVAAAITSAPDATDWVQLSKLVHDRNTG